MNPEETARLAAEAAHVAAFKAGNASVGEKRDAADAIDARDETIEEEKTAAEVKKESSSEPGSEIGKAASKSFAAAKKADELLAEIRGQPQLSSLLLLLLLLLL